MAHEFSSIIEAGYLDRAATEGYRQFFVPLGGAALLGCGDDRRLTAANARNLSKRYPRALPAGDPAQAYVSIFGGWGGVASTLLTAGTAAFGPDFIEEIGGYDGAVDVTGSLLEVKGRDGADVNITALYHSDESKERSEETFRTSGDSPLGCARENSRGAITALGAKHPLVRAVGIHNLRRVLGTSSEQEDRLLEAVDAVNTHEQVLAGPDTSFAVGRQRVVSHSTAFGLERPYMIVAGGHDKNAPFLYSLLRGRVGSAALAHAAGKPAYRGDAGILAEAFATGLGIDPAITAGAVLLDGAATRAALGAHSTTEGEVPIYDPGKQPLGVISDGDPRDAIQHMQREYRTHY
jgi:hypothetical protein